MENAASFCPAGGQIEVSLVANAQYWDITVSNEGPLLADKLQERLFDPMVSARNSDSSDVHLGLGLHIVKLIADFHNGSAKASNLPNDTGVRFTLTLPSKKHHAAAEGIDR